VSRQRGAGRIDQQVEHGGVVVSGEQQGAADEHVAGPREHDPAFVGGLIAAIRAVARDRPQLRLGQGRVLRCRSDPGHEVGHVGALRRVERAQIHRVELEGLHEGQGNPVR
jgi:hypothetical protein